jgi:ABC-type lipoprotein release transport system permease subunit
MTLATTAFAIVDGVLVKPARRASATNPVRALRAE